MRAFFYGTANTPVHATLRKRTTFAPPSRLGGAEKSGPVGPRPGFALLWRHPLTFAVGVHHATLNDPELDGDQERLGLFLGWLHSCDFGADGGVRAALKSAQVSAPCWPPLMPWACSPWRRPLMNAARSVSGMPHWSYPAPRTISFTRSGVSCSRATGCGAV